MRYRRSKSVGPFRLTATSKGLSVSTGIPGARISANTRGEVRATGSIPGTGLSHTQRLDGGTAAQPAAQPETNTERRARLRAARAEFKANVRTGMPRSEARALLRAANTWKVQA